VQNLKLDGASWKGAYLPADIFSGGATLTWTLGTTPDANWGSSHSDAPPSNTTDLMPALGYLGGADNGDVVVSPGRSTTLTLGVQSMSGVTQTVRFTSSATTGSGIVVIPATGKFVVPTEAKATERVELKVASGTKDGQYLVRFSLRTTSGADLPQVVAEVDVV
jgi:hypothetical protein